MKTVNINIAPNIEITYVIGQNQHENHQVLDGADPADIWFHIDGMSSAHVVARLGDLKPALDRKQRGKALRQGAVLCKSHTTKAVSQRNIPIVYTECRHVEKTPVPGAVIASNTRTLTL
jgi:predicted ribosome quality control (RQC) complex YloA/Tae2 family protein